MTDTVVITLRDKEFTITNWDRFEFSRHSGKSSFNKAVFNPNVKLDGYLPRITHQTRAGSPELRIEFSAPKLLLGNNFDELDNSHFEPLIQKLHYSLKLAGVEVYPFHLRKAEVSSIHYSKNIVLTDHTTSGMILAELGKVNLTKWLDVSTRDYRDGGHTLYYTTPKKKFMIVFYDKIKELEQVKKSDKGRVEQDGIIQLNLLKEIEKIQPFEVLRIEIRFNERRKLKQVLGKLGIEQDLKFANLFSKNISQSILQDYWKIIEAGTDHLTIDTRNQDRLTERIIKANKDIKPLKALAISSALVQINKVGVLRFRNMMKPIMNDRYWYDFKKEIFDITPSLRNTNYLAMAQIGRQIDKFESVHLKSYKQLDYVNNSKVLLS